MKRELYALTDEPFAMFVNRAGEVLGEEGIPHNIVGGAAVQGHLLHMLTERYDADVHELLTGPDVRVQDYLRSTDDIDVALKLEGDDIQKILRINGFLPKFAFEDISPNGEYIVEARLARKGASRPTFRLYTDGQGSDADVVAMNINRGNGDDIKGIDDSWYNILIEQSQRLVIPYAGDYELAMQVPRLEHLFASKIAGSRAKDLMDLKNLSDLAKEGGRDIDFAELERVLLPLNEKQYSSFLQANYPDVELAG